MQEFFKIHQQKIAITLGYALVFLLAFALGRISISLPDPPDIKIEEPATQLQPNNTAEVKGLQSVNPISTTTKNSLLPTPEGDCAGKIKGNISSASRIYHLPGGAFYKRTAAEACFNTEAEAQAAGFRKSRR